MTVAPLNLSQVRDEASGVQEKGTKKRRKKPAPMKLHVHAEDKMFIMNVGRGSQDLRWPSMAAAQRYNSMTKSREECGSENGSARIVVSFLCNQWRCDLREAARAWIGHGGRFHSSKDKN